MELSPQYRLMFAVFISSLIAFRSYKRKPLDLSGGIAGFLVMTIHFTAGFRHGALLLVFFLTSSKLTRVAKRDELMLSLRKVDKETGQFTSFIFVGSFFLSFGFRRFSFSKFC